MKNSLFLLHLFLIGSASWAQKPIHPSSSETYAVIIGISDYQDTEIADLKYPAQDARSFAAFMKSKTGGKLSDGHIQLLINDQATIGGIVAGLEWLIDVGKAGDKAVIYFSGYGIEDEPNPIKPSFLVPYDASASIFMPRGFPYRRLKRILSNWAKVRNIELVMMMDAYPMENLKEPKKAKSFSPKDTVSMFELSVTASNAPRLATAELVNLNERTTFTSLLLEGLIGFADENGNKNITILEAGNYVKTRIPYQEISTGMLYLMSKTENICISTVDDDAMKAMDKHKGWLPPIAQLEADGYEKSLLVKVDTAIQYLYQDFMVAIELDNLLHPPGESADDFMAEINQKADYKKLKNSMRRKLTAALQDETQKAINSYLKTDSREMAIRWEYRDNYSHFPRYLERAAELLGNKHYLYKSIKAKEYYFRGLTMRLEANELIDKKTLLNEALTVQHLALTYEEQAAFIFNEIGVIHSELENWDSSALYFNNATEWAPRWGIPWTNLCIVLGEKEEYDEAIRYGKEAIRVEPKYTNAYNHLGIIYLKMKDYPTAEKYFKTAIEIDPTFPPSYYNLGCSKSLRGQRLSAIKWIERAIKVGYNDFELMKTDPDLNNLRGMNRFQKLAHYQSKN